MGDSEGGDKYRSHLSGEAEKNTKWRDGAPPNYDSVNKLFEEGRTKVWPPGSLEEQVQNMVKTWEMEMFNKTRFADHKTLVDPNTYTKSLNGRKPITLEETRKIGGGYNSFLQTSLPEELRGYNPAVETVESAHLAFRTTFPRGFALEVLQVYSGPPVIAYKFRHWGYMEGPFQGYPPTGELVELFGIGIFHVDEKMSVEKVEFFFDRGELLGGLMRGGTKGSGGSVSSTSTGAPSCPFLASK
ncbi:unnamed protein product [Linum trigynum]|uniref:Pathogen-related protein n=1 Tax=Linum trigynum TaxID=586398 RepID=A0AAV2GTU1_9ROSI